RDAISLLLEVPPDSFDVTVDVRLAAPMRHLLDRAAELRREAALASEAAAQAMTEAARALLGGGLTMREAGLVLGLSHQRVLHLVNRPPATCRPAPRLRFPACRRRWRTTSGRSPAGPPSRSITAATTWAACWRSRTACS